ncbi:hypothetical protein NY588_09715 [Curtobacterium flaccumfaciens pv. beticola]|uniref:hypothetical protein n=1 Tax=Curtobacterium flaccumfaciens TaxID=2035 RepID=UPI00349FC7BA|nr:hypothetical protein [Curtobacterium flaccumfaciens pv. basellae]
MITFALPKVFLNAEGGPQGWTVPVTIVAAVLAALAVLLDRVADTYDKRDADRELKGSESTAEASASELNSFLIEAIEATFLERTARSTAIQALRRSLVRFAANSVGPGSRATYYTLLSSVPGNRELGDPQHATTVGRQDMPARPWVERNSPDHEMWRILDAPDQHPDVHNDPEDVGDPEWSWSEVRYNTFLTIPVKAHGIVFGVLSVNNATAGAIGAAQRAIIISMARVMALTLAFDAGVGTMKDRDANGAMSHEAASLFEDQETDGSHE